MAEGLLSDSFYFSCLYLIAASLLWHLF